MQFVFLMWALSYYVFTIHRLPFDLGALKSVHCSRFTGSPLYISLWAGRVPRKAFTIDRCSRFTVFTLTGFTVLAKFGAKNEHRARFEPMSWDIL